MLAQNYGWPDGILGGLGPAGSTTPVHVLRISSRVDRRKPSRYKDYVLIVNSNSAKHYDFYCVNLCKYCEH